MPVSVSDRLTVSMRRTCSPVEQLALQWRVRAANRLSSHDHGDRELGPIATIRLVSAARLAPARRLFAAVAAAAGLVLAATTSGVGQGAALRVTVRDSLSGAALPNAELIDEEHEVHRFTDEQGRAFIEWPADRRLRLRVRQIGYHAVNRTFGAAENGALPDSAIIALSRLAYVLPTVTARAAHCGAASDTTAQTLAASALEQLRMAAARYTAFRIAYPFRVYAERRSSTLDRFGQNRVTAAREDVDSDHWGDRYQPGQVVHDGALGFSVSILFLPALADSVFWSHHCFSARMVDTALARGERTRSYVALSFIPDSTVRRPDWAGVAFLESETSGLRRVAFHLAPLGAGDSPRRLEGYTVFSSPSPYIVLPESTFAGWWRRDPDPNTGWGAPDVVQLLAVQQIKFRKATPPPSFAPASR